MLIKERLVQELQAAGYDFMTACSEAQRAIDEVRSLPHGTSRTYHIQGGASFTLRKS